MNRKFKGIWIPAEVWLSPNFTLQEKVFYAEIESLSDENDGCYATNEYFADFFGISVTRVSLVISSMEKKGLIKRVLLKDEGNKRLLYTLFNESCIPSLIKVKDPIQQKLKTIYKEDNKIDNKVYNTLSVSSETGPQQSLFNEENKPEQTPNPGPLSPIIPTFEQFWKTYDKKTGKVSSEKLWDKLTPEAKQAALFYIPTYHTKQPEVKYRKDPERYIKARLWEDGENDNISTGTTFQPTNPFNVSGNNEDYQKLITQKQAPSNFDNQR